MAGGMARKPKEAIAFYTVLTISPSERSSFLPRGSGYGSLRHAQGRLGHCHCQQFRRRAGRHPAGIQIPRHALSFSMTRMISSRSKILEAFPVQSQRLRSMGTARDAEPFSRRQERANDE